MTRRIARLAIVIVAMFGQSARPLSAQNSVRVVDGTGGPVPATRIEVYGLGELLGVVTSDRDGVATLPAERWSEVRRLSLSHLGFQTLIVQADELVPSATLRLEPKPVGIEGFEVEVRGQLCPVEESVEARQLWSDVAARYSRDTGRRRLAASYLFGAGSVRETSLHHVSNASLSRVSESRIPTVGRRAESAIGLLEFVIERGGYSWRPAQKRWGVRDLHRVYPSLELWHAYHFATQTFGELHRFAVLRSRDESTVLAFCPRSDRGGTEIMGTLELVPGSHFMSASWRFLVDDPDEDAGGEVDFVDYREGVTRLPHLLAGRGVFFRHNGRDPPYPDLPRAYYREAAAEVDWQVIPPGGSG